MTLNYRISRFSRNEAKLPTYPTFVLVRCVLRTIESEMTIDNFLHLIVDDAK